MALPAGVSLVFLLLYLATAVVSAGLAGILYRRGTDRSVDRLVVLLSLAAGIWSAGGAFKLLADTLAGTVFWHQVGYVGLLALPVLMLLFAINYGGFERLASRRFVLGLFLVPALGLAALVTDPVHQLYYRDVRLVLRSGATILVTDVGPLFWVIATYSWGLLFVSIGLLVLSSTGARDAYDRPPLLAVLGILLPWPVNLMFITGTWPYPGLDPTPIAVGTGLAVVGIVTVRGRFLDLLPIAREEVLQALDDPVVIVDDARRVADFNRSAETVLRLDEHSVGVAIDEVLPEALEPTDSDPGAWETTVDGARRYFSLHRQRIPGRAGRIGTALVLRDVTPIKRQQLTNQQEHDLKDAVREAIVESRARADVETILCGELVDRGFRAAWTCGWDAGEIDVRAVAGVSASALLDGFDEPDHPWNRAIEIEDLVVEDVRVGGPFDRGAIAAVPLALEGMLFGALVVYSTKDGFDRYERRLLRELADTLAFAFATIERREVLLSNRVREATLRLTDPDYYLASIATDERFRGATVTVYDIAVDAKTSIDFLYVENASIEQVRDVVGDHPSVVRASAITGPEGGARLKVTVDPPTVATTASAMGGFVRSITVADGSVDVVVDFSRRTDVQRALGRFEEAFPGTKLLSLTDHERDALAPTVGLSALLTAKQRRALEAAFRNGFFERPQRHTAEEIAAELGISRSTFLHHVREAEQRLVESVFR